MNGPLVHKLRHDRLPGRNAGQFGFTLVELITIMVVAGILAAVAVPKFFDRKGFDAAAYSNQLRAIIRFGQKVAIAQNRNVFVRLNGTGVALCYDAACASKVAPAGGVNSGSTVTLASCSSLTSWACEGVPSGLTVSTASMFFFDPVGKPFLTTDTPPTLISTFTDLTITVSGDGENHNTVILAETGYVS